jgi:hypothetical protein
MNIMVLQKVQNLYNSKNYTYPRWYSAANSNDQLGITNARATNDPKSQWNSVPKRFLQVLVTLILLDSLKGALIMRSGIGIPS